MLALDLATLQNTIGALFVCSVLSAGLFGISCLQAYIYFINFRDDWIVLRVAVGVLWILEALHLAISMTTIHSTMLNIYFNSLTLISADWHFKATVATTVLIVLLVETLYGVRIWRLSQNFQNKVFGWIVLGAVAAGYGLGILLIVYTLRLNTLLEINNMKWVVWACLGSISFKDILICMAMCYYLSKTRTGFLKTNNTIIRLMSYVIGTGMLTCAGTIVTIICFTLMPDNSIFLATLLILTHLYMNSFLSMLNSRKSLRDSSSHSRSESTVSQHSVGRVRFQTSQIITRDSQHQPSTSISSLTGSSPFAHPGPHTKEDVFRGKHSSFIPLPPVPHLHWRPDSYLSGAGSRIIEMGAHDDQDDDSSLRVTKYKIGYTYRSE